MTIPVVPEICSATRIKRPETLHAVCDRIPSTGRRTVRHRRGRCTVIARTIVGAIRSGQRAAHERAPDNSTGNRSRAPTPTSASPLHGLGNIRNGLGDRKWLADRCRIGCAGEHNDAAGEHRHGRSLQDWLAPESMISEPGCSHPARDRCTRQFRRAVGPLLARQPLL